MAKAQGISVRAELYRALLIERPMLMERDAASLTVREKMVCDMWFEEVRLLRVRGVFNLDDARGLINGDPLP